MNQQRHAIYAGDTSFYQGGRRSQAEFEAAAQQLLDRGHAFEACDLVRIGLEQFPSSIALRLSKARALIRTGVPDEALSTLDALRALFDTDEKRSSLDYAEVSGLRGRILKQRWLEGQRDAGESALAAYEEGVDAAGGYYPAINAATMALLLEKWEKASALARKVVDSCHPDSATDEVERYWREATVAEACLLLGQTAESTNHYHTAAKIAHAQRAHALVVSSYQQLDMISKRCPQLVPAGLLQELSPPRTVVFVNPRAAGPTKASVLDASLEDVVRLSLDRALDKLEALVGYTTASSELELLFVEAMLRRGAEVHLVLPCAAEALAQAWIKVMSGGDRWAARFRNALRAAASVSRATEEHLLGDRALFDFTNSVMIGMADVRAQSMSTTPHLLRVQGASPNAPVLTDQALARWPANLCHDIELPTTNKAPVATAKRTVKALLFADVVGFSKLDEEQTPFFMRIFNRELARVLEPLRPQFLNTWGDGIFAVDDDLLRMLDFALRLNETVKTIEWHKHKLPDSMSIRVALHAGPVFTGRDALARRTNYYGSHVNRAARIEPIALPDKVYASEQFVGRLLTAARAAGRGCPCNYGNVGTVSLPKNSGVLHLYELTPLQRPTAAAP